MKHFELRFLDRSDTVVLMRAFTGSDDLSALMEAEKQSATFTIEIWDGNRKVARVKQGNLPLASTDRVGG